jgi:hypothetical protein
MNANVDSRGNRAGRPRQPDSSSLSERAIGHARGYSIGSGGKRADVWSPYTVRNAGLSVGPGVPCRNIAASSHGLGCEYGYRDQRSRHEGHFGHCCLHMVTEAEEARLLIVKCGHAWEIFHHALSTKRELHRCSRCTRLKADRWEDDYSSFVSRLVDLKARMSFWSTLLRGAIDPHGYAAVARALVSHAGGTPGWRCDLPRLPAECWRLSQAHH